MAVITGTINGISLLQKGHALNGNSDEESWLVTADFAAYDASADSGDLSAVGAAITSAARDGKTRTLRAAHGCGAGEANTAEDVYFGAMTVSTDDLTFSLTQVDRSTEVADFTTAVGVPCVVTCTAS